MRILVTFLAALIFAVGASAGNVVPENVPLGELTANADIACDSLDRCMFGDIILHEGDLAELGAVTFGRWTAGRIVYQFDNGLTNAQKSTFATACNAWTFGTPLSCAERTNESNYIRVKTHFGDACGGAWISCSELGMRKNGQDLYIYNGHWSGHGPVIVHEIGHAIGLIHEHQRPDRDRYILVIERNIQQGAGSQFSKSAYNISGMSDYDFDSIMHYENCLFSVYDDCISGPDTKQVIQALSCSRDGVGGSSITQLDRQAIIRAYAPGFTALFAHSRNASCQSVGYNHARWVQVCADGSCPFGLPRIAWKKVVTRTAETCSSFPAGKERALCAEIKREYIDSWTDTDRMSCPWGADRNELWSVCGCSVATASSICADPSDRLYASYEERDRELDWRQGRTLHFLDVMDDLNRSGLLDASAAGNVDELLVKNYLDRRFETKLAATRAGIFSYAKWKRSLDPNYSMSRETMDNIARAHRLRPGTGD